MGRSPQEIEDQVTYPLSLKLQGLAGVKVVRSSSEFNFSMITIIFDDGTDFYFARQRVIEKLAQAGDVPAAGRRRRTWPPTPRRSARSSGTPSSGPEQPIDPGRLWALNNCYVAPAAQPACPAWPRSPPSAGCRWSTRSTSTRRSCGPTASRWARCTRPSAGSNLPVGGRVIQKGNAEYLVRGVGWIKDKRRHREHGRQGGRTARRSTSRTWPRSRSGTQFRRSVLEKDGNEVVGGVVLMRHGENPLARHRARQGEDPGAAAGPARRACGSSRPTTARG